MTNELLKYSSTSNKVGFAVGGDMFVNSALKPRVEQIDKIDILANNCRDWYEPIYVNEHKYLPVSTQESLETMPMEDMPLPSVEDLTIPPQEKKENLLVSALLVGGVAMILFKLITD
jgi:hypothetical protein